MNGLNFGCCDGKDVNCSCFILLLLLLCGGCGNNTCGENTGGCDICTILAILILLGAI